MFTICMADHVVSEDVGIEFVQDIFGLDTTDKNVFPYPERTIGRQERADMVRQLTALVSVGLHADTIILTDCDIVLAAFRVAVHEGVIKPEDIVLLTRVRDKYHLGEWLHYTSHFGVDGEIVPWVRDVLDVYESQLIKLL